MNYLLNKEDFIYMNLSFPEETVESIIPTLGIDAENG